MRALTLLTLSALAACASGTGGSAGPAAPQTTRVMGGGGLSGSSVTMATENAPNLSRVAFPLDAVWRAQQAERPSRDQRRHAWPDSGVIIEQILLGDLRLGPEQLSRMRKAEAGMRSRGRRGRLPHLAAGFRRRIGSGRIGIFGRLRHHLAVLGDAGWPYHDADGLVRAITTLDRDAVRAGQWDRYTALYNPARVMALFDQHLIQPALRNPDRRRPQLDTGWRDTLAYWQLKLAMRLGSLNT